MTYKIRMMVVTWIEGYDHNIHVVEVMKEYNRFLPQNQKYSIA